MSVPHVVVIVRLPAPSGLSGEKASVTSSLRNITCFRIRFVNGTEGVRGTSEKRRELPVQKRAGGRGTAIAALVCTGIKAAGATQPAENNLLTSLYL